MSRIEDFKNIFSYFTVDSIFIRNSNFSRMISCNPHYGIILGCQANSAIIYQDNKYLLFFYD